MTIEIETKHRPFFICDYCNGHNEPYMIRRGLWELAGFKRNQRVCISCVQIALGRNLEMPDFTEVPLNLPLFYGAMFSDPKNAHIWKAVIDKIKLYSTEVNGIHLSRLKNRTAYENPCIGDQT